MSTGEHHLPDPATVAHPLGDPLGEVLHLLKLTGTFYCQAELSAPWGIEVPRIEDMLAFLVVTEGCAWIEIPGQPPQPVGKGELVLLTGGAAHHLRSSAEARGAPRTALAELPVRRITEAYETLHHGGGGDVTRAMYGLMRFDHAAGQRLLGLMPELLRIDSWGAASGDWLHSTLQFIAREARDLRPGSETVITRLADVVVIEAIRSWINTAPEANRGWLRALRDPRVAPAIMAMHRSPAEAWTLERLAAEAGLSRSGFSARFTELVGQSAMQYLTDWRMQLARLRLLQGREPLAVIAADLGYHSEPAFSRAFKRVFGLSPGRLRQDQRPAGDRSEGPGG